MGRATEESQFYLQQEKSYILISRASRPAVGLTLPTKWVLGILPLDEVTGVGENCPSPPYSAQIK
jgi:hypothetical protein